MKKKELDKILADHKKWLANNGGSRADLRRAYLRRADLEGADLRRAYLQGADLEGADLEGADLQGAYLQGADLRRAMHRWVQVAFAGHGECGRMLTCYQQSADSEVVFQCGCFYGSEKELKEYIKDGDPDLASSRKLAMRTAKKLMEA